MNRNHTLETYLPQLDNTCPPFKQKFKTCQRQRKKKGLKEKASIGVRIKHDTDFEIIRQKI